MKRKNIMRILSVAANTLFLFAGSIILFVFSRAENLSVPDGSPVVGIFSFISLLLLIVIFIIEFVSALRISSSTFHTVFIALFLLLYVVFCPDMFSFYKLIGAPQITIAGQIAGEFSFIGMEISLLSFFRHDFRTGGKKLPMYPLLVAAAISVVFYLLPFPSQGKVFIHIFFLIAVIVCFIILQTRSYLADVDNATFAFASAIFSAVAGMHTANALYYDGYVPYAGGLSSAYIWVCIFCFFCIYLTFFIRIDRKASRAEDYKLQNERLKMKVLVEQIKPHFISNALTTIKSGYHSDLAKGDSALDLFSEYMRKSISLIDTDFIPFEEELQNIFHYIEFINMSRAHPFNVIYNIDATDFRVPAFSLQPFVENAVKYSKVNEKADGYIMISAATEGDLTEIKITDNGVGFDVSQISSGAHGISNAAARFRLLFNTEPVIVSSPSAGTEITITLRHTEENQP